MKMGVNDGATVPFANDCKGAGVGVGVGEGGGECFGGDEEGVGVCVIGCVGEGVVRFVRFVRFVKF